MTLHRGRSKRGHLPSVFACLLIGCCAALWQVGAQIPAAPLSPAQRHSLGLEAQSVANGGTSQVSGSAVGLPLADNIVVQSASDRRLATNRTNVKISVRNFSTALDKVRVEWFFVALPLNVPAAENHEFIFHHDDQALAIPGGKTATQVVSSPEVLAVYERGTTVATAPTGYTFAGGYTSILSLANTQRGLTIRGWMVRLVAEDGSVLAAKGSSRTYEDIAANPARLTGMLARPGSGRN